MRYSVIVPVYNDGALADDFCSALEAEFRRHLGKEAIASDVEVIFVDDGSRDTSVELLKETCAKHPFAKMIALSRNFGQHIAISCGYHHARGSFIGYLNIDQEDPLDQLVLLFEELEKGDVDIVGGLYAKRDVPFLAKITSFSFNVILSRLTGYDTPVNASTVRVMNRRFIDAYNSLTERSRYIPGLEMWLGFKYKRVPVKHQRRRVGQSSYTFRRRLRMAIASIISFSDYPLRLSVKFGFTVAVLGFLLAFALIVDKLFFHAFLPGYLSTIAAIVSLGGVQIMVTGVGSLYVGRVLLEVQGRPLYVVRERKGDLPDRSP